MSLDAIVAASSDGARGTDLTSLARTAEEHFYLAMLATRDRDVVAAAVQRCPQRFPYRARLIVARLHIACSRS